MACTKDRIKNNLDAKIRMAQIELNVKTHRKMKERQEPKRYYRCPDCGYLHLTSQE